MRRDSQTYEVMPKDGERHVALFLFEFIVFGIPALGIFFLIILGIALAILAFSKPAHAHSWYDHACCSERDCYPISSSDVESLPNGAWRVKQTGEIFSGPHGNSPLGRVRFSPDGGFHRCSWNGNRQSPSICLYIPLPDGT